MRGAPARARASEAALHLPEAPRVAGDEARGAGGVDVLERLREDLGGHLRQAHRERSAEAAALVGARQLDELDALEVSQDLPRALGLVESPQQMARVVVGDTPADGRPEPASAEHLDEELRELVGPPREAERVRLQRWILHEARALVLDHPRARARRHDTVAGVAKERH